MAGSKPVAPDTAEQKTEDASTEAKVDGKRPGNQDDVGKTMTHQEAVKSWKDLAKYMHGLDKLLKQKDQQIETLQKEKAEESLRSCACNEELKRVQEENRTLKIRAEVAVRMLKTANQELDDLAVAANNVVTSDWDKIGENMKELKQAIEEWDFPGCAENA